MGVERRALDPDSQVPTGVAPGLGGRKTMGIKQGHPPTPIRSFSATEASTLSFSLCSLGDSRAARGWEQGGSPRPWS